MSDVYEPSAVPPALTAKTITVEERLRILKIGEIATWEDLMRYAEASRVGVYTSVRSARRRLLRASRMLFKTVNGVGVERIDDSGAAETEVPAAVNRLRSRARTLSRLTDAIDIDKLNETNKVRVIGSAQLARMTMAAGSAKAVAQLGSGVAGQRSLAESFDALRRLVKGVES